MKLLTQTGSTAARIENFITGGQINIEVSISMTSDAFSVSNDPAYIWSVDSTLGLQFSPSTGVLTLIANGSSNSWTLALGWRNLATLDIWLKVGGGVAPTLQYRNTYTHGEGYSDSGKPIVVPLGPTVAAISKTGPMVFLSKYDGTATLNATLLGINTHMVSGTPSWALTWPITGGSSTRNWIAEGDSLTAGLNGTTGGYPAQAATILGTGWTVTNQGISGERVGASAGAGTGMLALLATHVYASLSATKSNACTIYGGTNDVVNGITAAATYVLLQQWYGAVKSYCANASTAPAWQSAHVYAAGAVIFDATSGKVQQTVAGGTSGGSVPTFSATANTTVADNTVTWASTGLAKPAGVFTVKIGAHTLEQFTGTNGSLFPALSALIRAGLGTDYDFLLMDMNLDSVIGLDTSGTGNPVPIWREATHLHGTDSYYDRQGSIDAQSLAAAIP